MLRAGRVSSKDLFTKENILRIIEEAKAQKA